MAIRWSFEYDADIWLPVPTGSGSTDANGLDAWRAETAESFLSRGLVQAGDRAVLDTVLTAVQKLAADRVDDGFLFAFLPDPTREFLPLFVHVEEAAEESSDYLLDQIGARDDTSIDPPTVSYVEAKHLGEGVRVMRFGASAGDEVYASMLYAWRCQGMDVVVFTQTYDLPVLVGAQEAIDRFIDGIVPLDGTADVDE